MGTRILVDLLGFTGSRGGTETYARELIPRLPMRMPDVEFVALANREAADRVRSFFPGDVRVAGWVGSGRLAWAAGEVLAADRAASRVRADLLWCPANFGPIVRGTPRVVTLHDVIYHEVPGGAADRFLRAGTSWLTFRSATTADRVITVSRAAADAIHRVVGLAVDSIDVVHNGVSTPGPVDGPRDPLTRFLPGSPTRPVVLSIGNRMPHKNFEGLLRGIAQIAPADRPLVIIAGGGEADPLAELVRDLGLAADVLLPGWVTSAELEALYAVADLYVCPSLAEGFGLPVIDALRRGCAVLANDIPVLREVGGSVASYTDARDPRVLATDIRAALAASGDASQRSARAEWASTFTWDSTADGTAAVLQSVLAGIVGQR